jgi:hypothetical protein
MLRESAFAAVFFDDRDYFVIDKLSRSLTNEFFFVVQLRIKIDVIHSSESGHTALLVGTTFAAVLRFAV